MSDLDLSIYIGSFSGLIFVIATFDRYKIVRIYVPNL